MNIKQATDQIRGAIRAYLSRDERGLYRIPFRMQRPVIMFGPPGVGKTAVVAQVADEMDINFVSYSITHHTRQTALGLPFISQEEFGGRTYSVSEYTMSEIIAAVYHAQEKSGVDRGILFLDEVNCVSETLAPAMLQFLQYKTFGQHQLPEGWIIVCACNPPEYNRSAREFDPAMMDRMKRIDVAPDLEVWQEYAAATGVHPAVTTFLESKPERFYKVAASVTGSVLVTPRGWDDLSRMIGAYEAEDIAVDESLVRQYLQDDTTAREFAAYYALFRKYQDDYKINEILAGAGLGVGPSMVRAQEARFDERVALVGLLQDKLLGRTRGVIELEEALIFARGDLLELKPRLEAAGFDAGADLIAQHRAKIAAAPVVGTREKGQVGDRNSVRAIRLGILSAAIDATAHAAAQQGGFGAPGAGFANAYEAAKAEFNRQVAIQRSEIEQTHANIDNAFAFMDAAFGEESQECLILVTKLSADSALIKFVSEYGSDQFLRHNKKLLFDERGLDLMQAIQSLENDGGLNAPGSSTFSA